MNTPTTPVLPVVAFRYKENRGNGRFDYSYHLPEDESKAYKDNCLEIEPLCKVSDALAAIAATQSAAPIAPSPEPVCLHDDTQRLGAIWTHCLQCEKKWADDDAAPPAQAAQPAQREGCDYVVEAGKLCRKCRQIHQAAPSQPTDAERYQFIKSGGQYVVKVKDLTIFCGPSPDHFHGYGKALDKAIDAAITASKGGAA